MPKTQKLALLIAGITIVIATVALLDRDGVLPWATLLIGSGLIGKIWLKPSAKDVAVSLGFMLIAGCLWAGTVYYVISTYESGEVVELAINTDKGAHTARVWVLDMEADEVVYYEADPHVADALLAGGPLQYTRGDATSTRIPDAKRVDAIPPAEANRILGIMAEKYQERMTAADIYYVMLGSPRDRVALVVTLKRT